MKYIMVSLAKAVHLREIPKNLIDGMKLLNPNSGMTSLVFEKSDDEVRIFTRDRQKYEYSLSSWGLKLGKAVDIIERVKYNKDIYVYDMPKLYPVNGENKKIAQLITKTVDKSWYKNPHLKFNKNYETLIDAINTLKESKVKNIIYTRAIEELEELADYISNYDDRQVGLDIAVRNFRQTKDGTLVMYDPILDRELINAMRNR